MGPPDQFISPDQWSSIKATIAVLNGAEAEQADLPGWLYEFRDHLTQLLIATSPPVEPFALTEHFAWLLHQYVAGAAEQDDVADGSLLVVEWATQTLDACEQMGITPKQNGKECIWLVVQAIGGQVEEV